MVTHNQATSGPQSPKVDVSVKLAGPLLEKMMIACHKGGKGNPAIWTDYVLIGIDPGETTGFCYHQPWKPGVFHLTQLETKDVVQGFLILQYVITQVIQTKWPTLIITEDYKVYEWKSASHSWAGLHTPQLIGAIKVLAYQLGLDPVASVQLFFQMAVEAKHFVTDDKLKAWGIYDPGQRHARDAQRHLIRFAFFGSLEPKTKPG